MKRIHLAPDQGQLVVCINLRFLGKGEGDLWSKKMIHSQLLSSNRVY
jgi:hypothetical protein